MDSPNPKAIKRRIAELQGEIEVCHRQLKQQEIYHPHTEREVRFRPQDDDAASISIAPSQPPEPIRSARPDPPRQTPPSAHHPPQRAPSPGGSGSPAPPGPRAGGTVRSVSQALPFGGPPRPTSSQGPHSTPRPARPSQHNSLPSESRPRPSSSSQPSGNGSHLRPSSSSQATPPPPPSVRSGSVSHGQAPVRPHAAAVAGGPSRYAAGPVASVSAAPAPAPAPAARQAVRQPVLPQARQPMGGAQPSSSRATVSSVSNPRPDNAGGATVPVDGSCLSLVRSKGTQPDLFLRKRALAPGFRRKPRALALNPELPNRFFASALDGVVNVWDMTRLHDGIKIHRSVPCLAPKSNHWPEDALWMRNGEEIAMTFTAEKEGHQLGILRVETSLVAFMTDRPHRKGLVHCIGTRPDGDSLITGGADHKVVLWMPALVGDRFRATVLHESHSSAVRGVAGLANRNIVVSAGADKKFVLWDVTRGKCIHSDASNESGLVAVLPNPMDPAMVAIQSSKSGEQMRLYDIRTKRKEVHLFGWQQGKDSQSAYMTASWSPNGLQMATGSEDPKILVFDIRWMSKLPVLTLSTVHQKRVWKAVWHCEAPLLVSMSSDYNVGLSTVVPR